MGENETSEQKVLELTDAEKQLIEKQRKIQERIKICMDKINNALIEGDCYLAINGVIQIAGNIATSQQRIDVLPKG